MCRSALVRWGSGVRWDLRFSQWSSSLQRCWGWGWGLCRVLPLQTCQMMCSWTLLYRKLYNEKKEKENNITNNYLVSRFLEFGGKPHICDWQSFAQIVYIIYWKVKSDLRIAFKLEHFFTALVQSGGKLCVERTQKFPFHTRPPSKVNMHGRLVLKALICSSVSTKIPPALHTTPTHKSQNNGKAQNDAGLLWQHLVIRSRHSHHQVHEQEKLL